MVGSGLSNAQKVARASRSGSQPLQRTTGCRRCWEPSWACPATPASGCSRSSTPTTAAHANEAKYVARFSGGSGGGDLYGLPYEAHDGQQLHDGHRLATWRKDGVPRRDAIDGDPNLTVLTQFAGPSQFNFTLDSIRDQGGKTIFSEGVRFLQNVGAADEGFTYQGADWSTQGTNWSHAGWFFNGPDGNPYQWGANGTSSTNAVAVETCTPPPSRCLPPSRQSINQGQPNGSAATLQMAEAVDINRHVPGRTVLDDSRNTPTPTTSTGRRSTEPSRRGLPAGTVGLIQPGPSVRGFALRPFSSPKAGLTFEPVPAKPNSRSEEKRFEVGPASKSRSAFPLQHQVPRAGVREQQRADAGAGLEDRLHHRLLARPRVGVEKPPRRPGQIPSSSCPSAKPIASVARSSATSARWSSPAGTKLAHAKGT